MTYGGVGAPNVNEGVGNNLAGLVIDDLDGDGHLDTVLTLGKVPSDFFALHVCIFVC